jgi:hypothetical protein
MSYVARPGGHRAIKLGRLDTSRSSPHLEAARLSLGRAALSAGHLIVLAAIQERATFRAGHVVVKVDSDTHRLEHELAMMAAAGGVGVSVPDLIAFERGHPAYS